MADPTVKNLYTGTTTGVLYTDRRDFYLKPKSFAELFPNVSPFTKFLMKANFRTGLADPVFKLFEHKAPWERQYMTTTSAVTFTAAATGAGTEVGPVTFDAAYGLPFSSTSTPAISSALDNTLWEVWDSAGETLRGNAILTDAVSATTADFKNLTETAFTTVSGDKFVMIGNAQDEGIVAPEAWHDELKVVWNQCQIHRTAVEITGTLAQASLRGANKELARLRADKMAEHKIGIEKSLLFGASPLGTNLSEGDTFTDLDKLTGRNDKVSRTTVGLVRALELYGATSGDYQSVFTVTSASTYGDLVDILETVFQYVPMSGSKDTFCGAGALGWWSKRAMEKNSGFVINQDSAHRNIAGQKVRTLITPHGDLNLILTHSFKYEHKNQMLMADPTNLEYVQYRPSKFSANIKTDDGYDGVKDEYFSDSGIGITNIKAHQLIKIA
jgi:hypothetical protein